MAGSYADAPDFRMAYDRDGSALIHIVFTGSSVTTVTWPINVEHQGPDLDSDLWGYEVAPFGSFKWGIVGVGVLFPELRDLEAYSIVAYQIGIGAAFLNVETSTNTTNMIDGTWTNRGNPFTNKSLDKPSFRSPTTLTGATGVKAIRFRFQGHTSGSGGSSVEILHLYGHIASGQNPDRLIWWDAVSDVEATPPYLDLGDVPRGATDYRDIRVKNNSGSLTATDVEISIEALTESTSPTNVAQHTFSLDGVTWEPSINIGDLGPGEISDVITIRRETSPSAEMGLWWPRFVAHPTAMV